MSKSGVSAVVAVAACGTVTVAAGCGGSASAAACRPGSSSGTVVAAGAPRHLSVVGAAAAKTQHAGSARISMRTSGTTSASFAMTGVTDFVHQRAVIEVSGGNGDFGGQMRLVGRCEYIEAMTFGQSLPIKKPWASIDIDQIFPGLTGASSATTASDSLKELEHAGTFHRVGVRRVRGVETTLYSGTVAAAKVSAELPKRLGDVLKQEHVTSIPTRAWIDGSGYLREFTESVNGVLVTIEYYDFGVPVQVTAPSPADVQDLTSKFKSELGG